MLHKNVSNCQDGFPFYRSLVQSLMALNLTSLKVFLGEWIAIPLELNFSTLQYCYIVWNWHKYDDLEVPKDFPSDLNLGNSMASLRR